ncbi:MAG: cyclase family protein [bacterium]
MFEIDLKKYRIVDLSYLVVPPGSEDRPFEISRGYLADRAYKYDVKTHSHVGTHVEAPAHFFDGGKDTTELPLTSFMGRGIVLDVLDATAHRAITPEYLEEAIGDIIREGDIVICRNLDSESKRSRETMPHLTPEAAEWLRDHKIKMLGIDNNFRLGEDVPSGRKLHDILMSHNVTLIEWLDNLGELRRREFFFIALPFKVKQMDSSWVRAIAIEEK